MNNYWELPWKVIAYLGNEFFSISNKNTKEMVSTNSRSLADHIVSCVNFCGEYSDEFLQEMTLSALINHMTYIKKIRQRDTLYVVVRYDKDYLLSIEYQTWDEQRAYEICDERNETWYMLYAEEPYFVQQVSIPEE